ncbi:MAG: ester cyclase [Chloroflexia bacterium]
MISTSNKESVEQLIQALVAAMNRHDIESLLALTAQDYEGVDVNQQLPQHGQGEARMAFEHYLAAFPDMCFVEHDAVIQENRAVLVWKGRGTHLGTIMHIPPTGRRVEVLGTSTFHFEDGKIKKAVHVWDVASMLREIGLLPEL